MKKSEMKKISKIIAKQLNLTIINNSIYFGEIGKNTMLCNAYDNKCGDCKQIFFDFGYCNYIMIQSLSPVTIHKSKKFDFIYDIENETAKIIYDVNTYDFN